MLEELKAVVDRLDAVKAQLAEECSPPLWDHFTAGLQYPPVMSVCNNIAVISAKFLVADMTAQSHTGLHAPGVSVCMLTHETR